MPVTFNKDLLGTFTLEQNGNEFPIEIRRGNCLAVMIFDQGDSYMLYNFFADEAHVKAIIRNSDHPKPLFHGEAKNFRLNMKFKESANLLQYIVKETEVTCYYE